MIYFNITLLIVSYNGRVVCLLIYTLVLSLERVFNPCGGTIPYDKFCEITFAPLVIFSPSLV